MRINLFLLASLLGLTLIIAAIASASTMTLEEADTSFEGVWEINRGRDGDFYISDFDGEKILRVDASGVYTLYLDAGPAVDAKPDSAGNIWFTDYWQTLGRIEQDSGVLTTWSLTGAQNLGGLAISEAGQVWLSQAFGSDIYRFDPSSTEVCTYSVGAPSEYVLYGAGAVWLGNWADDLIVRLDDSTNQAISWQIEGSSVRPWGLALDAEGDLWWTDTGLEALAQLEPDLDRMTTYSLPVGTTPQMITFEGERIWYAESGSGTVGMLDPSTAVGMTATLSVDSNTVTPDCAILSSNAPTSVSASSGSLAWASQSLAPLVNEAGWLVYELPDAPRSPYGVAHGSGYVWLTDQLSIPVRKLQRLPQDMT